MVLLYLNFAQMRIHSHSLTSISYLLFHKYSWNEVLKSWIFLMHLQQMWYHQKSMFLLFYLSSYCLPLHGIASYCIALHFLLGTSKKDKRQKRRAKLYFNTILLDIRQRPLKLTSRNDNKLNFKRAPYNSIIKIRISISI